MKANIFMTIRNAKIETVKKVIENTFKEDDDYRKLSDILTPDEFVVLFDYLASATNFENDEDMDRHFLEAFGEVCVERDYPLSPETKKRIMEEICEDFFLPSLI